MILRLSTEEKRILHFFSEGKSQKETAHLTKYTEHYLQHKLTVCRLRNGGLTRYQLMYLWGTMQITEIKR